MSTAPRIPRIGRARIPVGGRGTWTNLPSYVRVAIGLAVGTAIVVALRALLP